MRSILAPTLAVLLVTATLAVDARAQGVPIGFEEDFALATDRAKVLERLIPGTAEYYHYRCLERQHAGDLDEVDRVLATWIERHGRSGLVQEIERRQALLRHRADPAGSFAMLRKMLGLSFDDRSEAPGSAPELPDRLDPALVSFEAFSRRALAAHPGSLDGFSDSALRGLAAGEIDDALLGDLLSRLGRPDVPNLPALVVRHLEARQGRSFGAFPIHRLMTLEQLEECARLRPELLADSNFVSAFLPRLLPDEDRDWRIDGSLREAYLERLEDFARRLPAVHNSLKAHVLHHRLAHDLGFGRVDRRRLLDYLRLPRRTSYANPDYLRRQTSSEGFVSPGARYPTGLAQIGDDEGLVRACLERIFLEEDALAPWSEFVLPSWLKRVLAETRILAGTGDPERWYSLLDDPAYYEALRERVEIEFASTRTTHFEPGEAVVIDVDLKNVPTLLVKVYEIDTLNYYAQVGQEVTASLPIEGLVPSEERTLTVEDNPFLRVRRRLEFPEMSRPGVWIVELIGNGLSSRAVVRKGRLRFVERPGAAGHVFRVLDDAGEPVDDATILIGSKEHVPDEDGRILVPYTTEPGEKAIVLRAGDRATLERFEHLAERYELRAGVYVDREALLANRSAKLLLRPTLLLNGLPAALELLEDPVLTIVSTDRSGVSSTLEVRDLELRADRDYEHEIRVPDRLVRLGVRLRGRVRSLSADRDVDLVASEVSFDLNFIDATDRVAAPLLARSRSGWFLELRGRSGEPLAGRPVRLRLRHRDFRDAFDVTLRSDDRGRVELGGLEDLTELRATDLPDQVGTWSLSLRDRSPRRRIQARTGEVLRVPYQGRFREATRAVATLFEIRGDLPYRDRSGEIALEGRFLVLRDLPAGDHALHLLESDEEILIRVTEGSSLEGWAMGRDRMLEEAGLDPLHITAMGISDDALVVRCSGAGATTRLHVVGGRYLPAYDLLAGLAPPPTPLPVEVGLVHPDTTYESGRRVAEEMRYILERRYAAKFPGNMLQRPGILLNPWAVEETDSSIGLGGGAGGQFGGRGRGGRALRRSQSGSAATYGLRPGVFANLDFLPAGSRLLSNLRPDADGLVRIPLADLGDATMIQVLAEDDDDAVLETLSRDESPLRPLDLRLARALDVERPFAEQRDIDFLSPGASTTVEDAARGRLEIYDSLESVFRLYLTLGGDSGLADFAFLLDWPSLDPERKRALYSEHACHELHFFLHEKDPEFFSEVVRPYLANKADRTFLDLWLLGEDLESFLAPWDFSRLNVVERILLTRRIAARRASGVRHVRELCELRPTTPELLEALFGTALAGAALSPETATGLDFFAPADKPALGLRLLDEMGRSQNQTPPPGRPAREPAEDAAMDELAEAEELEEAKGDRENQNLERLDRAAEKLKDLSRDLEQRRKAASYYRAPEATRRYAEQNYRNLPIREQNADLVRANPFWRDFAESSDDEPFVSSAFVHSAGNFTEMMLALAVLDLPFRSTRHGITVEGRTTRIEAAGPLLLVRREVRPAPVAEDPDPVLLSQSFYRLDEPETFVDGTPRPREVKGEFLVGVPYGCRVVLTNPNPAPRKLDLLLQVPQGSIPVLGGVATRGVPVQVDAYGTTTVEYHFYFPLPGEFAHYPVHAARDGRVLAAASGSTPMRAVLESSEVDENAWEYVSQRGSNDRVMEYLRGANLLRVDLSRIAWRLRDREFFGRLVSHLRERHVYDERVWSYALLHGDAAAAGEYLSNLEGFVAGCGPALESSLLEIDPVERRDYQHIEYRPLFNARAHRFGARREILNNDLARQYLALLRILCYRPRLDSQDLMSVTYYLLLQDRIEEARATFAKVDPGELPCRLQHDYMRCYMDFFTDDRRVARRVAETHRDHPVTRWRGLFREVIAQLDEAEGKAVGPGDESDRTRRMTDLANDEPALELAVEAGKIAITHRNLASCELRFYEMDVEFLFSTSPFVQKDSGGFAWVKPNRSVVVELPGDGDAVTLDLPKVYENSNLLVEVRGGGLVRRQTYLSNTLSVQMLESYGQVKIADAETRAPLPKVYVKVFARKADGSVRFHKDGYTDLRGRFDYASLSGPGADDAERFAILVLSEGDGAAIREVAPPTR